MRKRKMLIGVLTAAMLLGNVSPAMVQGAQAADVTEVPAETETEELATESAGTEVDETTETAVTESEENQPSETTVTETNEERLTEESATEAAPTETEEATTEIEVTETEEEAITWDADKTADAKADKNGFIIEDGVLTGYTGPGGDIVIPKGVTSIGDCAFYDCDSITSVSIPKSVTSIEDSAFEGCSSLTGIMLPNGLKNIGGGAFDSCTSLTSINIPESVTNIEWGAFSDCSSLTSFTIPKYVTCIESGTFKGCSKLANIDIPEWITSIGDQAFAESGLKNVVIPASVTHFSDGMFRDCNELQYVTFSNGITKVSVDGFGEWFARCKKLKKIIIPKSLENIDFAQICLENESLEAIEIDNNNQAYQSIDGIVYNKSGTKMLFCPKGFKGEAIIPDGVKELDTWWWGGFGNCRKLESVVIPGSVETIDQSAFLHCKELKKVIIKDGVKTIRNAAFENCTGLTDITIPASVTEMDAYTAYVYYGLGDPFYGCNKNNITIHCRKGSYAESYAYGHGYKIKTDITGTNQIIIASNFTKTYGDAAFSIDAVTSGDGKLSYVSDNESVAKVDAKGKVTLTGVGTAHITITASETKNYSEAKKVITITVKKKDSAGNTDNNSNLITAKNITKTYGCKAFSLGAKSKSGGKLTYSVADKKVATVDKKGKVTVKGYGQTKITITSAAKGKYPKAKKTITLTVKPVKTRIASVKSTKSKNMVVKWKKDTKATGYVIQYSTDKKFKKGVKTVTITKNKTTSKTIGKLKGGKNYYVRVCTYKKSNGKQIKGSYSAVKSIKVKK